MDKEQTKGIAAQMLNESFGYAKEKLEKLINSREFDFNLFGDVNTFARCLVDVILEGEREQYTANFLNDTTKNKKYKELKKILKYEIGFIH